jgi:CubicO group peptidase (beta-lactamase class C family)
MVRALKRMMSLIGLPVVAAVLAINGVHAETVFPGKHWNEPAASPAGWSADKLDIARRQARSIGSTAVMVIDDGKVVAAWGDPGKKVFLHSVRKSLVSALYGIAVRDGKIGLADTLATLGIDDKPPSLSAGEKQAKVIDLLMARSGVYHIAAAEPQSMRERRPDRGSHAPGTFWFYNNWDFNVLGTIYEQKTGETVFRGFNRMIAEPIGMEDFEVRDGQFQYVPESEHPAYLFKMTARDLARFGLMYLAGGTWQGREVVPAAWVHDSTVAKSDAAPGIGYGYLWRRLFSARRWRPVHRDSADAALGRGASL